MHCCDRLTKLLVYVFFYFRSQGKMLWRCKYCPFNCENRAQLFKHYRLKHGSYARTEPFPCLHHECLCTFKSLNALKVHLSRLHTKTPEQQPSADVPVKFCCLLCGFAQSCSETDYLTHLRTAHFKVGLIID